MEMCRKGGGLWWKGRQYIRRKMRRIFAHSRFVEKIENKISK